jgi:hypothetical protein
MCWFLVELRWVASVRPADQAFARPGAAQRLHGVAVGVVAADHEVAALGGGLGVDQVLVVGAGDVRAEDHVGRAGLMFTATVPNAPPLTITNAVEAGRDRRQRDDRVGVDPEQLAGVFGVERLVALSVSRTVYAPRVAEARRVELDDHHAADTKRCTKPMKVPPTGLNTNVSSSVA